MLCWFLTWISHKYTCVPFFLSSFFSGVGVGTYLSVSFSLESSVSLTPLHTAVSLTFGSRGLSDSALNSTCPGLTRDQPQASVHWSGCCSSGGVTGVEGIKGCPFHPPGGSHTACLEPVSVQACKTTVQTVPSGPPHSTGKPHLLGPWNGHAHCFVN